jgi:hypothetical protein
MKLIGYKIAGSFFNLIQTAVVKLFAHQKRRGRRA